MPDPEPRSEDGATEGLVQQFPELCADSNRRLQDLQHRLGQLRQRRLDPKANDPGHSFAAIRSTVRRQPANGTALSSGSATDPAHSSLRPAGRMRGGGDNDSPGDNEEHGPHHPGKRKRWDPLTTTSAEDALWHQSKKRGRSDAAAPSSAPAAAAAALRDAPHLRKQPPPGQQQQQRARNNTTPSVAISTRNERYNSTVDRQYRSVTAPLKDAIARGSAL